jgi:hypothetical protein
MPLVSSRTRATALLKWKRSRASVTLQILARQAFARDGCSGRRQECEALVDDPPEPVEVAPGPIDPGIRPFQIPIRRAVREHEQPRGVGAVGFDDLARVDGVELGFAHLLDPAGDHATAVSGRELPLLVLDHLLGLEPVAGLVPIGLMGDHALGEETGERLV